MKVLIKLFQKVMLAFGKLRLCLVGFRLHFPSEKRQSRAEHEAEPHFNAKALAFASMLQKIRSFASDFWTESILPECREVLRSVTFYRYLILCFFFFSLLLLLF